MLPRSLLKKQSGLLRGTLKPENMFNKADKQTLHFQYVYIRIYTYTRTSRYTVNLYLPTCIYMVFMYIRDTTYG